MTSAGRAPLADENDAWLPMKLAPVEVRSVVFSEWGLFTGFVALALGIYLRRWEVASTAFLFLLTGLANLALVAHLAGRLGAGLSGCSGTAFAGQEMPATLKVENAGRLPIFDCSFTAILPESLWLECEGEEVLVSALREAEQAARWEFDRLWPSCAGRRKFSVALRGATPGEGTELVLRFAARRRGVFAIPREAAFALEVADLMGLYRARVGVAVPGIDSLVVFPRIIDAPRDTNRSGGPDGKSSPVWSVWKDPSEPVCLRDYLPSDKARDINWKASALGQGIKTNIFESSASGTVVVALDVSDLSELRERIVSAQRLGEGTWAGGLSLFEARFEAAVSVAASIFLDMMDAGCAVGFETNSPPQPARIHPGKGDRHAFAVMECLASLDPYRPGFPRSGELLKEDLGAWRGQAQVIVVKPRKPYGPADPADGGLDGLLADVFCLSHAGEIPPAAFSGEVIHPLP